MSNASMRVDWDRRFLRLCTHIAEWSKDPYHQYGAVIVGDRKRIVSIGYNGFPRGLDDTILSRYEKPESHLYLEHAERNAIYNSIEPLVNCKIYVNGPPCADCARAIIQSGITRVIISSQPPKQPYKKRRKLSNAAAVKMFGEANIATFIL